MKRFLMAIALAAPFSTPVLATDVGVSVTIGQPGFYGRIDIGGFPPPLVIYDTPRYVQRVPAGRPPIYLRVPPGHIKHWDKHCREYNACGEPVYFVRDDWYQREYVPRYQEHRGDYRDNGPGPRRDDYRPNQRHDNRHDNRDRDDEHGPGGPGHGR